MNYCRQIIHKKQITLKYEKRKKHTYKDIRATNEEY